MLSVVKVAPILLQEPFPNKATVGVEGWFIKAEKVADIENPPPCWINATFNFETLDIDIIAGLPNCVFVKVIKYHPVVPNCFLVLPISVSILEPLR